MLLASHRTCKLEDHPSLAVSATACSVYLQQPADAPYRGDHHPFKEEITKGGNRWTTKQGDIYTGNFVLVRGKPS